MTDAPVPLTVFGTAERLVLDQPRLVVAGYTGRNPAAVQAHIDELALIGVEPPPSVPTFYELDPGLLTTAPSITVDHPMTSGEVEPVVVSSGGHLYLGVGSDHTDRELETRSVAGSKAAAPKPLGSTVMPLADVLEKWDAITASCLVDGRPYQKGLLAAMLPPAHLLEELVRRGEALHPDAVLFCGTLPLLTGEFVHGSHYEMELRVPGIGSLGLSYAVDTAD